MPPSTEIEIPSSSIGALNGTVYGFLTQEGVFYVNVTLHDQAIPNGTVSNNYTLTVIGPILVFTSSPITEWVVNQSYDYQVTTNLSGVTFSLDEAPFWLSINSTGVVFGNPALGTFEISIRAVKGGQTVWQNYTLVVSAIGTTDWILIIFLVMFVILLVLGFVMPFVHILCGIEGIFFALFIFDTTDSIPLTIIMSAFSILILLLGITRKVEGI